MSAPPPTTTTAVHKWPGILISLPRTNKRGVQQTHEEHFINFITGDVCNGMNDHFHKMVLVKKVSAD